MDELQTEATALHGLGALKPTPVRVAQVRAALSSKWEGTQALALGVLAQWGGRDSIETIKAFLVDAFARELGWSIRGVAIRALATLVGPEDVDWALNLYFSRPQFLEKHELLGLVIRLPTKTARPRLVRELASNNPMNRQAAVKAIGNMAFDDVSALLKPMRTDPDKGVRDSAKALSR